MSQGLSTPPERAPSVPSPPHPTPTHLIQALLLSAFRPPLNTLAHGQPLQPAVGLVKGAEEGGGI